MEMVYLRKGSASCIAFAFLDQWPTAIKLHLSIFLTFNLQSHGLGWQFVVMMFQDRQLV